MNPVCMQYSQAFIEWGRRGASQTRVVKVHNKAEILEEDLDKCYARPTLRYTSDKSKEIWQGAYLNNM